jgi:peptidyl-prolyl cis-trans isomerase D
MARLMQVGYSMPDSVCLKAIATQEGQEDVELGWYQASDLSKTIAEPAFAGKRGTRFTVAQGLGEQTFEVIDIAKPTPKVKIAILERTVTPSSKTYSVIYNNAKQFIVNNPTEDAFRAAAAEAGMTVHPQFNLTKVTEKVGDLKASRPIVRWAFDAKEGQVSDVFECGEHFVVAVLTEANDDEYRPLEAVRAELTVEATNNKKAEYIINQLAKANTLEEAAEITGKSIQTAENVTLSGYRFGNAGNEPAVIGRTLALAEGEVSAPIQGRSGVFMVKAGAKTTAEGELNVETEKQQLTSRVAYMIPYQAIALIQEQADVEDNRANFQ